MSKPRKGMLTDIIGDMAKGIAPAVELAAHAPETPEPQPEPTTRPELVVVEPPAAAAPTEPEAAEPRPIQRTRAPRQGKPASKSAYRPPIRDRAKQLSLYLEDPVYEELRELAHTERKKMHALVIEGVDMLLKKRGCPSISELIKKAS